MATEAVRREEPRGGWTARRSGACSCARSINFSSYWRSTTFSSTVEPTIYLIAFGFGFGSLVATVGGYDYVDFVGTGTVATAVLFASVFPAMFGTFVKYKFQRTYDAILAAPVDTEELVTGEALWIGDARVGLRLRADARRDGVRARAELGHAARPVHRLPRGLRLGVRRHLDRRASSRRSRTSTTSRAPLITPLFLFAGHVLPDRRAARVGAGRSPSSTRCSTASSSSATPSSGWHGWVDVWHLAYIVVFGAAMWRLAIWAMTRKLID